MEVEVEMKRSLILVLALLIIPFVSAAAFSTVFTPVDNEILPNETATFEITISNFDNSQKRFQIYSIDPSWVVDVDPINVRVQPGSSETVTLSLKPKTNVAFGSQGITINVKDTESGDLVRKNIFVAVKRYDSSSGTYSPSVSFDIGLPQEVDPRTPTSFSIGLRNRNPLDIENMLITLESPHYTYETTISLEPLAEHTEYLTMRLDDQQAPGDYVMSGVLRYRNSTVTKVERSYTIGEYATVTKESSEQLFLFKSTTSHSLTNDGNVPRTVTATQPANLLERPFSNARGAEYRDGRYVWEVVVPPGQTSQVAFTQNYRWLIALIIIALAAVGLYYLYRSPIVALKEAVGVESDEGVSDLKLRVFVKNRSNKVIQGVEVYDKVPSIAEIKKSHAVGTIKPSKISKLKSGSLLRWDLDILEPYEERILTYTIESKLKIVGRMKMPQAKVKFETSKGQERIVYSNNILVVEK